MAEDDPIDIELLPRHSSDDDAVLHMGIKGFVDEKAGNVDKDTDGCDFDAVSAAEIRNGCGKETANAELSETVVYTEETAGNVDKDKDTDGCDFDAVSAAEIGNGCGKETANGELSETVAYTEETAGNVDKDTDGCDFDAVSVAEIGNGCGKETANAELSETVVYTEVGTQEREGGREKRLRKRGNRHKKSEAQNSCKGSEEYVVNEDQNRGKMYGDESKRMYSREEMEALRYVDIEAQNKKWVEMYCGLDPAIVKEYDSLANCNQKKQMQLDFDPRKQFQNVEMTRKVHGEDSEQFIDNETNCTGGDDSDDDCNSILRPAFFVSGEPKFDSGPPQDGFEYLRRVRWETERIPKVKVAKLEKSKVIREQTVYMPNIPDIAKCPEHLMPLKEWEDTFLAEFSELRLAFSRIDSSSDGSSSIVKVPSSVYKEESSPQNPDNLVEKINNIISNEVESCCDGESSSIINENTDKVKDCVTGSSKESPTLKMILDLDSVARLLMLRRRISSVVNMTTLSKNDCVWLFALCVAIDTPLDGDMCASLRCLLRKAASLRAEKTQIDDECIMLNIIATIAGKYFGQFG